MDHWHKPYSRWWLFTLNMKNLILVGASDWGLEVFSWLKHTKEFNKVWTFKGFLDDDKYKLLNKTYTEPFKILSSIVEYNIEENDVFVCTIAQPIVKKKVVEILLSKGAKFINLIHPTAIINDNATIGLGNIISAFCVLSNEVKIHNHIGINLSCTIGHNVIIEDYCQLSSQCDLTGYVKLYKGVFLGSKVSVIPKIILEENVTVGAGSVVIRKVKAQQTVFGNPAKKIN